MRTSAKGSQGEHEVMERLEAQGYECYRSSCSRGTFDVIALKRNGGGVIEIRAIQVKRFGKRRGYGVKTLLADLAKWRGAAWLRPSLMERQDRKPWTEIECGDELEQPARRARKAVANG